MSKYVKDLITRELTTRFKDVDGVAVINPRGINANKNNAIRRQLHDKKLKMTVVRNTLARRAVPDDSKIKGFDKLLEGPSAVVYGQQSMATIARLLLDLKKADDTLELRGIFFDGEVYADKAGVEQVSKLPTREEAIGQLVAQLLSPGRNLAGAIKGPGSKLGSILKAIEEKAPKGDEAAAAPAAPDAGTTPDAGAAPAAG